MHEHPSGFLAKGHLSRVSRSSVNDKGNNEVKPRAVHKSLETYLRDEENLRKLFDEGCETSCRLKWDP